MTSGLPGSGKSTFCKTLKGYRYISPDLIRKYHDVKGYSRNANNFVFKEVDKRLAKAAEDGVDCIFDATNLYKTYRKPYIEMFKEKGYTAVALVFETNRGVCIERDKNREQKVGERVIERMATGNQVEPRLGEFDEVVIIQDRDGNIVDHSDDGALDTILFKKRNKVIHKNKTTLAGGSGLKHTI